MSSFLYGLGRWAARRWALVAAVWLAVLAVAGGAALVLQKGLDDTFTIPGSQSQAALTQLKHVFPELAGTSAQMVLVMPEGARVRTPRVEAAVAGAVGEIRTVGQVAGVSSPFGGITRDAVSPDGRAAIVTVPLTVQQAQVEPRTKSELTAIGEGLAARIGGGARVYTGGDAYTDNVPGISATEGIGLLIALVVLFAVFRSLLAAALPVLSAVFGVGVSACLILAATRFTPISSTAPMLAVMIGLAVGIDYALFILSRHRDQLAQGLEVRESVARAMATAGSAVVFAGTTVVLALLGLSVAGIPFLTTMGLAAAVGVVIAVSVAATLLPALLSAAGERLRPRKKAAAHQRRTPFSRRWVRLATKVPWATTALIVVGLGLCILPARELQLALPDNGSQKPGSAARTTYDVVSEYFGPGYNSPLLLTAQVLDSDDPVGVTDRLADDVRRIPGVAAVPLATPDPKGIVAVVEVIPERGGDSESTKDLVLRLRADGDRFEREYGTRTAVTGITAVGIDVSDKLGAALVPFGALVVGVSLVLLAMVFRSVAVPVKAALGYLLSVVTAFGAVAFVFQLGHLTGLLKVTHTGSVISFLPIILMGVLFGLAMDYEVFLVSRIREAYVRTGDATGAIESGFVSASTVVTAAALIMTGVFTSFIPEGSATIKPIAFGLAVGVLTDAFLVRMTLVPAVLRLLGDRAWWLPPRLDRRLPHFDVEGAGLERELRLADWPEPGSAELVSAQGLTARDDRGAPVFTDVRLHLRPGQVLVVSGEGACGKSALLHTLAGRVRSFEGDLKTCGHLLPQHAGAVRREVALVRCRESADPGGELGAALRDGARLLLVDDLDLVTGPHQRARLAELFAETAAVVTCQDAASVEGLLPSDRTGVLSLAPVPQEAGRA
ncbi:MMPL family transporter [Actinocorallia libanotica]|uniref:MMPL family transporter n=1 Tax=Actinocorallia libanotica TaxID=46162 RepID=A0ABN1QEK2_9ACTN